MNRLRTVDLARAVGLSAQQVRNYEAWGFLPPVERSRSGYRLYTPRHLAALRTARRMIAAYGWQQTLGILQALHHGDLDAALAQIDAQHAQLDRQRGQVVQALKALRNTAMQPGTRPRIRSPRQLRIGAAAKQVGARVSALRYWEARGLLRPDRAESSRYRLYDEQQLHRLHMVVLLRQVGYGFETIQSVLDELASGRPEQALAAIEQRREELASASRAAIEATVAFWQYASAVDQPADP